MHYRCNQLDVASVNWLSSEMKRNNYILDNKLLGTLYHWQTAEQKNGYIASNP